MKGLVALMRREFSLAFGGGGGPLLALSFYACLVALLPLAAGRNPAQLGLLSAQVDLNFDNLASASANIKSGRLKALAVTTSQRSQALPDLPTVAESPAAIGLSRFDVGTWFGLFGPAKLPADVTQRLNQAFVEAMASPELRARMSSLMAEGSAGTPEQFAAFVKAELAKYEQVVKASGASTD